MNTLGIGVDLVEVPRVKSIIADKGPRVFERLLTQQEREYCESRADAATHVAVRLAAKEAVYKALQGNDAARGIGWRDIEVIRAPDGRPDIFVPHSNRLFLSTKDGKYREATELKEVFAWKPLHGEDWPCGAHFADLNRDGRFDLVLSVHCTKARNRVYINDGLKDGVPRFRDVTNEIGLGEAVPVRCPHVEVQDFDNDGWPDIYLSAALLQDGKVIGDAGSHIHLQKAGIEALLSSASAQHPWMYGTFAVFLAVVVGGGASLIFRRD